MAKLDEVTAGGRSADSMKKYGRYGDSEMAHVTPGEVVVPHSVQTPDVIASLQSRFNELGVPMERYVVRSTKNSKNPKTGKGEYFLKSLVKAAAPIVGGAIGGPAGAAIGGAVGGAIGGDAAAGGGGAAVGGGAYPVEANPLIQPVKAIAQGAAPIGGLAEVTPYQVSSGDENRSPVLAGDILKALDASPVAAGSLLGVGVRPVQGAVRRINPQTGMEEFFDEDRTSSMNPYTEKQEFADFQNNSQKLAYDLGYRGNYGSGDAWSWITSNPQIHAQFVNAVNSQPAGWANQPVSTPKATYTPSTPAPQPSNYGWTGSATNANDWLIENYNNIPSNIRDQAVQILSQIPVAAGSGSRSQALAQDPSLNSNITNQFRQLGLQVGSGGNTYVPPATAPNAPAPANANQTPAWVDPSGGSVPSASTGTPATSEKRVIGIYSTGGKVSPVGMAMGNVRVMTSDGQFFDAKQNPQTGKIDYTPADGLNGYSQVMGQDNLGLYNKPANSIRFGNDYNRQDLSIGSTFDYGNTSSSAPQTSSTPSYDTPNGQLSGNAGIRRGTPTYSNTSSPNDLNTSQDENNDYNDYFAQQQAQYTDWMKSMEDRLASFAAQNADSGADTSGDTNTSGVNDNASSGVGNTVDNLSTLSPRRGPRFRSSRAVGSRARGF